MPIFASLRSGGVTELQPYLVSTRSGGHCMGLSKCGCEPKTLELFRANSKEHLLANLDKVFVTKWANILPGNWWTCGGRLAYEREWRHYALDGEPLNIHLDSGHARP